MPQNSFYLWFLVIFFPLLVKSQNYLPADAILIANDSPKVRRVSIIAYGSEYVQFKNIDGRGPIIRLNAEQIQSFTLLNGKSKTSFETWSIARNRPVILRLHGSGGKVKLASTLNSEETQWYLRPDSTTIQAINSENYLAQLAALSNGQSYTREALKHVQFKQNALLRFLNYNGQHQKGLYSYFRIGPMFGYNWDELKLKRIVGAGFSGKISESAYKQRFHFGVQADIPFGISNRLSLYSALLYVIDDQAFVEKLSTDSPRRGLAIQSQHLEFPIMANMQLLPISTHKHWYSFAQMGIIFRQQLKIEPIHYRVVSIHEGVVETRYIPVKQENSTDFGLNAGFSLTHPLASKILLDMNVRYSYFLLRDLYAGRLRLSVGVLFGQ